MSEEHEKNMFQVEEWAYAKRQERAQDGKELKNGQGPEERKLKQGQQQKGGPRGTGEAMSHSRLGTYVNLVLSKDLTWTDFHFKKNPSGFCAEKIPQRKE